MIVLSYPSLRRSYWYGAYRYGFNGKEDDGEIMGGNFYDYGFRIYNPQIGRFLSMDPLTAEYPEWSPYPFAMNRPIDGIDQDGLQWAAVIRVSLRWVIEPAADFTIGLYRISQTKGLGVIANMNIWVDGVVNGTRTTFGKEVEMLESAGYRYNSESSTFTR